MFRAGMEAAFQTVAGRPETWPTCFVSVFPSAGDPDYRHVARFDLCPSQCGQPVIHTDLNCLAVMQYAVDVLQVKHIIVCGHYGCGGVKAALMHSRLGLIDNWIQHIQDVAETHAAYLESLQDERARFDRLCELNVIEQVRNACQTTFVQGAWERGQALSVHGVIYDIADGLLRDLRLLISSPDELDSVYHAALEVVRQGGSASLPFRAET